MTRLSELVPSIEVSRLLVAALVAAGATVSVASEGRLSSFAGGFASGAGAVLVASSLRSRRPRAEADARSGDAP